MLGFVRKGLADFSVSRSVQRAKGVGVPIPDDETQIMYVWFDALSIYITAIGFGYDPDKFAKYWPADVHVIGKGINRFHSVYWIGMLLSAGLPTPKSISVHGYITANGQKMSKSLGNVIDPFQLVEKYGLEPVRAYLLKEIPTHQDGDFSEERFREVFTADLANGLGNLCSRSAKLAEKNALEGQALPNSFEPQFESYFDNLELDLAMKWIWKKIAELDGYLSLEKPWAKPAEEQVIILKKVVVEILSIAFHLQPFLPDTAQKILHHFSAPKILALSPLFPRLSTVTQS